MKSLYQIFILDGFMTGNPPIRGKHFVTLSTYWSLRGYDFEGFTEYFNDHNSAMQHVNSLFISGKVQKDDVLTIQHVFGHNQFMA